jgi:transcriptional regulator with PAS, ATPase and Fis domain
LSHKSMVNNLKRISKIGDISHQYSQKILSKMGTLGKEIETMMIEQNHIVVLRSNRISALNTLVKLLCDGYSDSVIITDVKGEILSISNSFTENTKKEGNENTWKKLSDIRPDINLPDVLSHLEKQHLPWTNPEVKGVVCTPVFDKANMLNFCIWELETQHLNKLYKEKQNELIKKKTLSRAQILLKRFSRKKKDN